MTPEEFRQLVAMTTDMDLLGPCLRDFVTPFVFDARPAAWDRFRADLGLELGVAQADISVIGSGRFGFSLKPSSNLRAFTDKSDIDVIVVDANRFDHLWYALLRAAYPRPPITHWVGGWLKERQKELYTGWLSPLEIRLDKKIAGVRAQTVLDFNTTWFNTLKKASRHATRRHEDVKGRLYRSWEHAELYHLHSIAALRRSLAG